MRKKPTFKILNFIQQLSSLGQRQLTQEKKARGLIESILKQFGTSFTIQTFPTYIPNFISAFLQADGKNIPAQATGFVSGNITSTDCLVSSLTSSQKFLYDPNINFNPRCSSISRSNHYFAPSVAINKKDVPKLMNANRVFGKIRVKKTKHISANILVGNIIKPYAIIFCHYDSIGTGASDNASGVAVTLSLILNHPEQTRNNLFVVAGNEELSYDQPIYWGRGYRIFEKKYVRLMNMAKKLIVIDSLGVGLSTASTDQKLIHLGFPIKNIKTLSHKTKIICGDYKTLMTVYHSDLDIADRLNIKHILAGERIALRLLT